MIEIRRVIKQGVPRILVEISSGDDVNAEGMGYVYPLGTTLTFGSPEEIEEKGTSEIRCWTPSQEHVEFYRF